MYGFKKPPANSYGTTKSLGIGGPGSLLIDSVYRNAFLQFVHQRLGSPSIIGGGKVIFEPCGELLGMIQRVLALFVVAGGRIHIFEDGLPVDGLIESAGCAGSVGVFGSVLLVDFRFLLRALHSSLPVS